MTGAGATTETSLLAATDAGMHALWNPSRFTGITHYKTWEDPLADHAPGRQPVSTRNLPGAPERKPVSCSGCSHDDTTGCPQPGDSHPPPNVAG